MPRQLLCQVVAGSECELMVLTRHSYLVSEVNIKISVYLRCFGLKPCIGPRLLHANERLTKAVLATGHV